MLQLFEAKSEVYTMLTQSQKLIFQSCIEHGISLWSVMVSLSVRQRESIASSLKRFITLTLQDDPVQPEYSTLTNLICQPILP